jgi:glycosyltransferase involved in cell wall biosynthesis
VKTLVVWGRAAAARARRHPGAEFLLWDPRGEAALRAAGVAFTRASALLGEEDREAADEAAIAWTKAWGKRPIEGGKSFAQSLSWKGVSLWWFAELYLHHGTRGPARVRAVEHFFRVLERLRPEEVEAAGLEREDAVLLGRVCSVLGILFEGPRGGGAGAADTVRISLRSRWNTLKARLGGLKARLAGGPPAPPEGPATVLFLSHAAFWRERAGVNDEPTAFEHYFDRLIPAVGGEPGLQPYVVAVGPRAAFRRRGVAERWREWLRPHAAREPFVHVARFAGAGVLREVRAATRRLRAEWRRMRRLPAVAQAFAHRGVSFADFSSADLAGIMLLQLPWAVQAYEQTRALLRHVRPRVLSLYAESSGWGRAALAACAAEGVASLALQHGILYPTYFSYRHAPDEADCPRPDRTAVFGEAARRFLIERGGYAPESLVLTGSPKFDELLERAARWDRAALRRRLGLPEDEAVLVVASRFRAIRDTHHAIGAAVPALARAVDALGARCLVKPHPAEPAEPYERALREAGAQNTRVLPSTADLLELLYAADALVTVESLSAVEALVLGRPVVVLEMPTHLRDLVGAGVAVGVAAGADPEPALWSVLRDPDTREQLERARERYLSELAMGVDGRATERILGLLREMAAAVAPATDRTAAARTEAPGTPPSAPA